MALSSLFLVRHGQTEWHASGEIAGRSDIALSEAGREAVQQLAATLRSLADTPQAWYCSPLLRTRQSSSLLRQHYLSAEAGMATLPTEVLDERLVELNFGDWEGMSWAEVHAAQADALQTWAEDWVNRAPPGGERFSQQVSRCGAWLADTRQTLVGVDSAAAVVISHGGSIRALLCLCLDWPLERAMSVRVDPASLCHLQYSPREERWLARRINVRVCP